MRRVVRSILRGTIAIMRVAIVAESFLPQMNGVVNSVLRVVDHLESTGHTVVVTAPAPPRGVPGGPRMVGRRTPVHLLPAVQVPRVTSLPVGVPSPLLYRTLRDFEPDVVHLASPFVVGAAGAVAARALGVPVVAVFQTDVAGFAAAYRLGAVEKLAWRYTRRLHEMCDLTLAPSTATLEVLAAHGIPRLARWGRGVDVGLFSPDKRDPSLRADWLGAARDALVVGFVGRLAPEKHVERLAGLSGNPRVQLVIVGDGPERDRLQRAMPEAMASGLPVIGPDAGGPRDLVSAFRTGYLLEVGRFAAELPAIVESLHDESVRAAFGRAAVQAVRARTWPSVCAELVGHYARVTGRGVVTEVGRPA